jgi:hypothetical protein
VSHILHCSTYIVATFVDSATTIRQMPSFSRWVGHAETCAGGRSFGRPPSEILATNKDFSHTSFVAPAPALENH